MRPQRPRVCRRICLFPTNLFLSVPETQVTERSEDTAYTFGQKGFYRGCKAFPPNQYTEILTRKLTSQMPWSTSLIPTAWPEVNTRSGSRFLSPGSYVGIPSLHHGVTVNFSLLTVVPPGVVTLMKPVVAPAGTVVVMNSEPGTLKVADVLLNFTEVAPM